MSITIEVSLLRRHNLGNYEHVEGSVRAGVAVENTDNVEAIAADLQRRLLPLVSLHALTRGIAAAPVVTTMVVGNAEPAKPAEAPRRGPGRPKKEQAVEQPVEPVKAAEPAADDFAPEPEPVAEAPAAPADAFTDEPEPAAEATMTPAEIRKAVIAACANNPGVSAAATKLLISEGFTKFRDVPDEKLGLFVALLPK